MDSLVVFPSGVVVELRLGDITRAQTDAVVTAANASLSGGGGVDGAIHAAAGPRLLKHIRQLGGSETGQAVMSPAFDLESQGVKHVIHAVGPIWYGGSYDEPSLLESAYRRSLDLAVEHQLKTIAFPAISAGVYDYPIEAAARVAIRSVVEYLRPPGESIERVEFYLFDEPALDAFSSALEEASERQGHR
ncbi:MAG: macro domain-containing protein [Myxococcota bacterium]